MRRLALLLLAVAACGDDAPTAYFDVDAPRTQPERYWDLPFPSDLRLDGDGALDLAKFPNPRQVPILTQLLSVAGDRRGWPVQPVGYVRFTAPVPPRVLTDLVPDTDAVLLELATGTTYPIVARTLVEDPFVPSNLVAFAPRPGIVLAPNTTYALVVRSAFAPGFEPAAHFAALYAEHWPAIEAAGVPRADVLVATVFTTGDEVERVQRRSAIPAQATVENLALAGGDAYDGFCVLRGTITLPQFQKGTPPFDTDGRFELDGNDLPVRQRDATIPLVITIPKQAMPASGWPLYQYLHGSGGETIQLVDRGRVAMAGGEPELGKGPGWVVAKRGIAAVSAALPLNPERLPGASDYAYLNINNLIAFPYTFQQGVIEQRMLATALGTLRIPHATLAGCSVPAPAGGEHVFDTSRRMLGGQSMGGMYTNMIGAVDDRFRALVPTGAGGLWHMMILETELVPGARALLGTALGVDDAELSFVHPGMAALNLGWESADPVAYMARHATSNQHLYQSVPKGDENFPISIYDAAVLASGNQQAGEVVWPSLQDALEIDGLDGVLPYPVKGNRGGTTRVAVQFEGDGILDPHYIYQQLDAVKHQYACFLATYVRDGVPTVPAPGSVLDPCP